MQINIETIKGEPRAGTYLIAKGFNREHKIVLELIRNYESDFEDFGSLKRRKLESTGGRPATLEYWHGNKDGQYGLKSHCKQCCKQRIQENKRYLDKKKKQYYQKNKRAISVKNKQRYQKKQKCYC